MTKLPRSSAVFPTVFLLAYLGGCANVMPTSYGEVMAKREALSENHWRVEERIFDWLNTRWVEVGEFRYATKEECDAVLSQKQRCNRPVGIGGKEESDAT